ncbi:hypothetical protein OS493_010773 [Desmophyllum pertusum]|uniref:Uncharacterized protein n=1 Tax=Desmophyllum pertusum TaxID=174260 RepID=A0A9W9ZEX1_9CNID|nr:hypothetical protein OS493_010773 [Desmophyllum pertusum]
MKTSFVVALFCLALVAGFAIAVPLTEEDDFSPSDDFSEIQEDFAPELMTNDEPAVAEDENEDDPERELAEENDEDEEEDDYAIEEAEDDDELAEDENDLSDPIWKPYYPKHIPTPRPRRKGRPSPRRGRKGRKSVRRASGGRKRVRSRKRVRGRGRVRSRAGRRRGRGGYY